MFIKHGDNQKILKVYKKADEVEQDDKENTKALENLKEKIKEAKNAN